MSTPLFFAETFAASALAGGVGSLLGLHSVTLKRVFFVGLLVVALQMVIRGVEDLWLRTG